MVCISAACQVTVDLLHESPYWDKTYNQKMIIYVSSDTQNYIGGDFYPESSHLLELRIQS